MKRRHIDLVQGELPRNQEAPDWKRPAANGSTGEPWTHTHLEQRLLKHRLSSAKLGEAQSKIGQICRDLISEIDACRHTLQRRIHLQPIDGGFLSAPLSDLRAQVHDAVGRLTRNHSDISQDHLFLFCQEACQKLMHAEAMMELLIECQPAVSLQPHNKGLIASSAVGVAIAAALNPVVGLGAAVAWFATCTYLTCNRETAINESLQRKLIEWPLVMLDFVVNDVTQLETILSARLQQRSAMHDAEAFALRPISRVYKPEIMEEEEASIPNSEAPPGEHVRRPGELSDTVAKDGGSRRNFSPINDGSSVDDSERPSKIQVLKNEECFKRFNPESEPDRPLYIPNVMESATIPNLNQSAEGARIPSQLADAASAHDEDDRQKRCSSCNDGSVSSGDCRRANRAPILNSDDDSDFESRLDVPIFIRCRMKSLLPHARRSVHNGETITKGGQRTTRVGRVCSGCCKTL